MISLPPSTGSISPTSTTTVRLGRYQRSWNAWTAAGVAASSVLILPIGERSASGCPAKKVVRIRRSEEHTSELQSLMLNSYAVFCLKKNNKEHQTDIYTSSKSL